MNYKHWKPGDELPEGLIEDAYGNILFECRSCQKWTKLPCEIEDFEPDAPENMCGGSPWCIP